MSSGKDDYQEEDIVFAMVTGYPWWPGFITERYSKKNYKVTFFGDFSYADLSVKQIKPFTRELKRADPNNRELTEAIQSAKRVFEGQTTIDEEHQRVKESLRKSRKTRPITKKKKGGRRQNKARKSGTQEVERTIRTRARRRLKNRAKDDAVSQSMIQDPTHKRRGSQKRREARFGRSMDQKILEDSEQEAEPEKTEVLEELYEEEKTQKSKRLVSKSRARTRTRQRESRARSKRSAEKGSKAQAKKERNEQEEEASKKQENEDRKESPDKIKEEEPGEDEADQESKSESAQKAEAEQEEEGQGGAEGEKAGLELERPGGESAAKSEVKDKSEKKENEANGGSEQEELKEKFFGFEKELLVLLNEMQSNKPIPKIEENLKEWFNQISQINRFSPIVSTDIGKHLSKMSQICLERLNEKQIYNKILGNIEHLKNYIITQISKNFFNAEPTDELDSRLMNEDSIITTKKNDSSNKVERGDFSDRAVFEHSLRTQVDQKVRQRIRKKLAKSISRMTDRDTIRKRTCIMLGQRIEEFLHVESQGRDDAYRAHVVRLLEFMEKTSERFISEFIFQKNRKCDIQVLRDKVLRLLRSIN